MHMAKRDLVSPSGDDTYVPLFHTRSFLAVMQGPQRGPSNSWLILHSASMERARQLCIDLQCGAQEGGSFSPNYSAGVHVAALVGVVDAMAAEIDGLIFEIERELSSRTLDLAPAPQLIQAGSARTSMLGATSDGRLVPLKALVCGSVDAQRGVPSQIEAVPPEGGEGEVGRQGRLQITTDMRVGYLNWQLEH